MTTATTTAPAWFVLLVDDNDRSINPLLETAQLNGREYVGSQTGQTKEEMQRQYAYRVAVVAPERAHKLAAQYRPAQRPLRLRTAR